MANYKKKIELKRVNVNLPSNLVQRVEEYALSIGVNTTNAYIVLLNNALDQKDTLNNLPLIMELVNSVKQSVIDSVDNEEVK